MSSRVVPAIRVRKVVPAIRVQRVLWPIRPTWGSVVRFPPVSSRDQHSVPPPHQHLTPASATHLVEFRKRTPIPRAARRPEQAREQTEPPLGFRSAEDKDSIRPVCCCRCCCRTCRIPGRPIPGRPIPPRTKAARTIPAGLTIPRQERSSPLCAATCATGGHRAVPPAIGRRITGDGSTTAGR